MKRQIITIDCETLPAADSFTAGKFWSTEEEHLKTALDGNFGRLLCIGYMREFADGRPVERGCFGWNQETVRFGTDERKLLSDFWEGLRGFDRSRDTIVGHNVLDFDLPFILKRSIICGVRPTVNFSFARYQRQPIFDTMREWDCWNYRQWTGLDKLAAALGLAPPKDGAIAGGGGVYEAYLAGRHREIYEYCLRDVETTRLAYRRMNFLSEPEEARPLALAV